MDESGEQREARYKADKRSEDRKFIAIAAMVGILIAEQADPAVIAKRAYAIADAMQAESEASVAPPL